jgi:hypothetical protein
VDYHWATSAGKSGNPPHGQFSIICASIALDCALEKRHSRGPVHAMTTGPDSVNPPAGIDKCQFDAAGAAVDEVSGRSYTQRHDDRCTPSVASPPSPLRGRRSRLIVSSRPRMLIAALFPSRKTLRHRPSPHPSAGKRR